MKKAILIVIVVGMLGWAVYDFIASSNDSDQAITEKNEDTTETKKTSPAAEEKELEVKESDEIGLEKGQLAPDFELRTLDGETVKLSDYRGQRVMLNFWATWCPPCRAEMPDMQKFHENTDIVILAVNLRETEPSTEQVQQFVNDFGVTFSILLDEKIEVANQYQIQPIPTSFMIDSNGRISNKAFGALNYELMVQEFERMQ